jgi:hypothetical protein
MAGAYECRAGWGNARDPSLVFKNRVARTKAMRGEPGVAWLCLGRMEHPLLACPRAQYWRCSQRFTCGQLQTYSCNACRMLAHARNERLSYSAYSPVVFFAGQEKDRNVGANIHGPAVFFPAVQRPC